jgi:hypothetical protein
MYHSAGFEVVNIGSGNRSAPEVGCSREIFDPGFKFRTRAYRKSLKPK